MRARFVDHGGERGESGPDVPGRGGDTTQCAAVWASALLPVARCQSSGPLGALLSSPALVDVRLLTALQVLEVLCRARQVLQERALLLAAMGTAAITQI